MPNANEYKSGVGLDSLYYALITTDDSSAYTAGTPAYLAPAAEAKAEPSVDRKTQFADDMPYDAMSVEGETTIKLTVTGIPMDVLASITGRVFDSTTGRMYDNGGTPPYCALGFRSMKSNGVYRYFWFLKGRFDMPADEFGTKSDKVDPKTRELTFTAVKTIKTFVLSGSVTDGAKRVIGDADTTNFSATNWFAAVQYPAIASISALALSTIVPAANATGIAVSANVVLTFNNALATGEEADIILATAAGAQVACTTTIDATRKIVTVDPNSNMSGATVHIVSYAVKDIYAQTLAGVSKFTTT